MKTYRLVMVVIISSFFGGVVSNFLFAPQPAEGKAKTPPKVVQANRFELVDQQGTLRADLGVVDSDNSTYLAFYDPINPKDEIAFLLQVSKDGKTMKLFNGSGPHFGAAIDKEGHLTAFPGPRVIPIQK